MKLKKALHRYGLSIQAIKEVDLRDCYVQSTPNCNLDRFFFSQNDVSVVDRRMANSPHAELADFYYKNGTKWVRMMFGTTRYSQMFKHMGRRKVFTSRRIDLLESIRHKGYLGKKHRKEYIVLLEKPFANSRYERGVPCLVPEVWCGHHRVGALIALERYQAKVVIARDDHPGRKKCYGKIHDLCVERPQ